MALPHVLGAAGTAGILVFDVTKAVASNPPSSNAPDIIAASSAIVVAIIGGAVQIWLNRRRRAPKEGDELNDHARLIVNERNIADLRRDVDEILDHIRPWSGGERRRPR